MRVKPTLIPFHRIKSARIFHRPCDVLTGFILDCPMTPRVCQIHMKSLAPIGLSAYSRLSHLKQTVEAIQNNTLAQDSDLFIFSDAPAPGDEAKVAKVREYLRTVKGFRSVRMVERTKNDRVANNRGGMRQMLDEYGRFIFLEEDIVTAPGFLQFMNDALDTYQSHPGVFSISGYCPPVDWSTESDIFGLNRFCAWGFGITASNFEKIREIPTDAINHPSTLQISKNGRDIHKMVTLDAQGKINALDVRAMYWQHLEGSITIYPKKSLVQNIGHDGTGVHCGTSTRFNHHALWQKTGGFVFEQDPAVTQINQLKNQKFRDKRKFWKRILRWK